ncbi:MAG: hypothetical protein P4L57_05670 [Rhizomicrobium sp.]|nr:hypothetical protein [Rhizomicrobium sp.]
MRKQIPCVVALALLAGQAGAAGICALPQDAVAMQTAALQQEMMVAAFECHDVASYNNFVLSHQTALQQADAALLAYFTRVSPQTAFDDYNFYKTELANASSLHFLHDAQFCLKVNLDYRAARDRSLEQTLAEVPFTVDTGAVRCAWSPRPAPVIAAAAPNTAPPRRRVRYRTWLGRLLDWIRS